MLAQKRVVRAGEQILVKLQEAGGRRALVGQRRDAVDLERREDHVARRVAVAASASRNVGVQRRRALVVRGVYPVLERVRILRVVELRAPGSTQQMMPQQVAEAKVGHAHLCKHERAPAGLAHLPPADPSPRRRLACRLPHRVAPAG